PEYRQPAETVPHLPLMYRRTSTLAWFLPLDLLSKKKPALFRCGLFSVFPVRVSPHRYLW
ncbi:hypothetical protein, partial [Brevibacillus laterosporus]|uniref:hypothetical protein n=1 Tax=Brevibacillus laterosporus TaxID=1465 RepID=UPI001CA58798